MTNDKETQPIFTDPFGLEYGGEELFQMEFFDHERQPHIEYDTWWQKYDTWWQH